MAGSVNKSCSSTGQCFCRPRFSGLKCDVIEPNFFLPSVDFMTFQAEDAFAVSVSTNVYQYLLGVNVWTSLKSLSLFLGNLVSSSSHWFLFIFTCHPVMWYTVNILLILNMILILISNLRPKYIFILSTCSLGLMWSEITPFLLRTLCFPLKALFSECNILSHWSLDNILNNNLPYNETQWHHSMIGQVWYSILL